jgi:hypothetical protein
MDISLRMNTQAGTTVIHLFKDPASADSYKTFACTVSCPDEEFRADLPASELQDLLLAVTTARITPAGGCGFGLDGRSYELTIEDGRARATYGWWMTPEEGWSPLQEISHMLLDLGRRVSGQYLFS